MNKEKMTVHEALCELKTLNKRVHSAIAESTPIATKEQSASSVNGRTMADWIAYARSKHQSAVDLMDRMVAIKSAINKYNAEKHITVGDKDYTIAQAIWLMNHGMEYKQELLDRYSLLYEKAEKDIVKSNGPDLNARAEAAMNAIFGSKDRVDASLYLNGLQDYKKQHEKTMVDAINIRDVILDLETEISTFNAKVDSAIQVANATTVIEIEY